MESLKNDEALLVGSLHLTGSSSQNTTFLLAELKHERKSKADSAIILTIKGIYNKLGSSAARTANDSLHRVISELSALQSVFTDAPCSLPPCLTCSLDVCPGTAQCPDDNTIQMQQKWDSLKTPRRKKKQPLDPSRFRIEDFQLNKQSNLKPNASIHAGNYVSAIRMHQLKKMLRFSEALNPVELPFAFFEQLYLAHRLPGRFAAQRSTFLVGESRRYSLWKDAWSQGVIRYAPESRYLREPFEELELEQFYKNSMWFHCLGKLLFLRSQLDFHLHMADFPGSDLKPPKQ